MESLWTFGYSSIGDVSIESCNYVARYSLKKVNGKGADKHYRGRKPEFVTMSKGMGRQWIEMYLADVYPKGYCTFKGDKFMPPRYYDNYLKKVNPDLYTQIKVNRLKDVDTFYFERFGNYVGNKTCKVFDFAKLKAKRVIFEGRISKLVRGLDNELRVA